MAKKFEELLNKSKVWLSQDVFPLWGQVGIDRTNGGFFESLSFDGQAQQIPRRAMVQARQAYSFLTAAKLECTSKAFAEKTALDGIHYMIENFSQPSGAFIHSINPDGSLKNQTPDLYTQAFALFGLAQAYSINKSADFKSKAKSLTNYLKRERRVPGGGYTELNDKGEALYHSNPHMHLFEAAISWMLIDEDPEWKDLGQELATLCLNKFINPTSHVLGEYFDENWNHQLIDERFIYEPGHQYEWAWLLSLYEDLTGTDTKKVRHRLFQLAEQHGTSRAHRIVYDEMWSNYQPKKTSSRFWPQCERIKAAVRLGQEVPASEKGSYAFAADEAMETLFNFFETPHKGMWFDVLSEGHTFSGTSAKASSLYHIINAMEEYILLRPKLADSK